MKTFRLLGGVLLAIILTLGGTTAWSQPAGTNYFITFGSVWKYMDDGSDQGTAWRQANFNDGTWQSGLGQFGFGDGDEVTVTQFGPITTYFRTLFTVDNPSAVGMLRARVLQDDGCVIYLNGTEIFRSNMPTGTVTSSTFAVAPTENQLVQFSRPSSSLAHGLNVLAVEMHNTPNSGDLSFDFELYSLNTNQPPTLPVVRVLATDPQGAEIPPNMDAPENPAVFRIERAVGPTNSALAIAYSLGGTAENGADYAHLSGIAEMAAGADFVDVVVEVFSDNVVEGTENVVLTLAHPTCCYTLGSPSTASATISDTPGGGGTNALTTVNVVATDSDAAESGLLAAIFAGRFTFYRSPVTSNALMVSFVLSGSAANGVDYNYVSNAVRFNPGQGETRVDIIPRNDGLVEGTETVVLTLQEPVCAAIVPPPPGCYRVGPSNQAVVFIKDADSPQNQRPYVQLNEPRNGDVFTVPTNIILRAFAHDQEDGHEITVEFFAGTNRLGVGEFVPTLCPSPYCPYFQLVWANPPPGEYMLSARATDSSGASSNSAPVAITVKPRDPGTNVVTLIGNGSVWKYLDNGSDQGTAWRGLAFNDSAWVSGPAQLGYGDGDEATVVSFGPNPMNKYVTTYFRRSFNVVNAASFSEVRGNLLQDDGGVVYLNGVEIFRSNLPAGPISYNTLATIAVGENQAVPFSASEGLLREGLNVVAVEMHQINVNSSDLSFDLELIGTGAPQENHPPHVQLNEPQNGDVFTAPTQIVFRAYAEDREDGYSLSVEFFANGQSLGFGQFVPARCATPYCPYYELTWDNPAPGDYTLIVRATDRGGAMGSSEPVRVIVRPRDPGTNQPPQIRITAPAEGSTFEAPATIRIEAVTTDADGYASTVEFFANDQKIGERTMTFVQPPQPGQPIHFEFAWHNPPLGQHRLTARTADDRGAPGLSPPVNIIVRPRGVQPAPRGQDFPAVAANNELYFVVWADRRGTGDTQWDIYGARVSAQGQVLDADGILICSQPNIQWYPSVASDGRDFFVVWSDGRPSTGAATFYDIYGARVTAEGAVLDPGGSPITRAPFDQFGPSVAFNGTHYLAVWYDYRNSDNERLRNDIYGARIGRDGVLIDPDGIGICTAQDMQWAPGIAALGSDFFVAWSDSRGQVRGTRVSGAGEVSRPDGVILSPHFSGYSIRVAVNPTGYMTVWADGRNYQTTSDDIFARLITPAGEVVGPTDFVVSKAADTQHRPGVAGDPDQFLTAWVDNRFGQNDAAIFGARYRDGRVLETNGFLIGRHASTFPYTGPSLAHLNGQYLVAWTAGDFADADIVAARVNANGTVVDAEPLLVSRVASPYTDSDGDGVADERDRCPNTSPGSIVNAHGCSLAQLCPCANSWRNHGEYVACVIRHAWEFFRASLITRDQRRELIRDAVRSNCGRRPDRREPVCIHLFPLTLEECARDGMQFVLSGDANGPCRLETSDDLIYWTPVNDIEASVNGQEISCPVHSATGARFFRVRVDEP